MNSFKSLHFLSLAALIFLTFGCKDNKQNQSSNEPPMTMQERALLRIDSLEKMAQKDFAESAGKPTIDLHLNLTKNLEEYGYTYIDTLAPKFLFKAARIHEEVLKDKRKAITIYGNIYHDFPDFQDRAMMLFYQASAYHDVQDTTMSIKVFKFFMENYPQHPFVDDAEGMIKLIRMTEEERKKLFGGDFPS